MVYELWNLLKEHVVKINKSINVNLALNQCNIGLVKVLKVIKNQNIYPKSQNLNPSYFFWVLLCTEIATGWIWTLKKLSTGKGHGFWAWGQEGHLSPIHLIGTASRSDRLLGATLCPAVLNHVTGSSRSNLDAVRLKWKWLLNDGLVPVNTSHSHSYVSRLWHEGTNADNRVK